MTVMIVGVPVRVVEVMHFTRIMVVRLAVSVDMHRQRLLYEFAVPSAAPQNESLLESMTTGTREFVDGSGIHCHHQKWPTDSYD
jgi:hypothetical protein